MANKKYCKVPVFNDEAAKILSTFTIRGATVIDIPDSDFFFILLNKNGYYWYLSTPDSLVKSLTGYKYKEILKIKNFVIDDLKIHEEFLKLKYC